MSRCGRCICESDTLEKCLTLLIVDVIMMADCKTSLAWRSSDDHESCQDSTFNLSLATEDMFWSCVVAKRGRGPFLSLCLNF